ncbi:MAG: prepilin peptidase [Oscillospiraceae bacterium]|nr:prepilin peptidase [Oscillospiraceae bacterium]
MEAAFENILALVLGAALGSFLHCAAWRIARRESFLTGRSHCPLCGRSLGPAELVPVLSWLALRGRCRRCGARIPPRYVLSELAFALITLLALRRSGPLALCLRNLVFLGCLFCLSLVDMDIGEIPDGCLIIAALAWAAVVPFTISWKMAALRAGAGLFYGALLLVLSLFMDAWLKKESLGGGDIKLFAVVGLYLGWAGTLYALLLSCLLGLGMALAQRRGPGQPFPFSPAISLAAAWMLLYGQGLIDWYLSLVKAGM